MLEEYPKRSEVNGYSLEMYIYADLQRDNAQRFDGLKNYNSLRKSLNEVEK